MTSVPKTFTMYNGVTIPTVGYGTWKITDPDEAVRLRERYEEIGPAYHFNKTHWNGIRTAGDLPDAFIREQIRNSYLLVVRRSVTPRSLREEILRHVEEHGLPE